MIQFSFLFPEDWSTFRLAHPFLEFEAFYQTTISLELVIRKPLIHHELRHHAVLEDYLSF